MLQLIMVTDILYAVIDSELAAKKQVALGSMIEARDFMRDFHGTTGEQFDLALSEMRKTDRNAADFGVLRGDFMFTSQADVATLLGSLTN